MCPDQPQRPARRPLIVRRFRRNKHFFSPLLFLNEPLPGISPRHVWKISIRANIRTPDCVTDISSFLTTKARATLKLSSFEETPTVQGLVVVRGHPGYMRGFSINILKFFFITNGITTSLGGSSVEEPAEIRGNSGYNPGFPL